MSFGQSEVSEAKIFSMVKLTVPEVLFKSVIFLVQETQTGLYSSRYE